MAKYRYTKQRKKSEGAWKVAYADFITAMMAFFMLLWLLNSTPSEKLKHFGEYFKIFNSHSDEEGNNIEEDNISTNNEEKEIIQNQIIDILAHDKDQNAIKTQITEEGVEISVSEQNAEPMFNKESAELNEGAQFIVEAIAKIIIGINKPIAIAGHTTKQQELETSETTIEKWALGAARANAARRMLIANNVVPEVIAKTISYADNKPLIPSKPYDPRNRRISIVILTGNEANSYKKSIRVINKKQ